jgi:Flp pilus assembly protein TadD
MRIVESLFFASLIIVFLTACVGPTIAPESNTLSADVLLRAEPLTGDNDLANLSDVNVLEMDRDMLAFLDDNVNRDHGRTLKLHELLYAVITEGSFGLEYDEITRTAQETFAARLGNCLSFTNMFVAMAREVGIEVTYQEIDIPPNWSLQGGSYMLSRHVNVIVNLGAGESREVDFNIDDFQSSYDRRLITDERALAYYYSNIAAEHMQKKDTLEALRYFRKALATDARLAPAWSNLGALYSRAGFFKYAEAAYVHALEINPEELVAMSNLGHLYEYLGHAELAEWYSKQSHRHRMRNPYYRYNLAHKAFLAKDYDSAIRHLKVSVRKKKSEDTFYFLMGLSYLQKGDESRAHRWLEKAEQVAVDDGLKRGYHSKLEMLLGAN